MEILVGCLVNELKDDHSEIWFEIYEKLKNHIFLALTDSDLCAFSSEILRKMFTF